MDDRAMPDGSTAVPLSGRLAEAVLRELTQEEPSAERLGDSVRAYALEAYARGVPPERMLVALKAVVAESTEALDPRARAALVAALIPFALEGYYLDPWMRRTGELRTWIARRVNGASAEGAGEAASGER